MKNVTKRPRMTGTERMRALLLMLKKRLALDTETLRKTRK